MTPGAHYFDERPAVPSRRATVTLSLPGLEVELARDRGVFGGTSASVDAGTMVLLRTAPAPPVTGHVLDLGCGYGPIAVALAVRSPGAVVWAVDVNERALELTAANAAAAGLSNVRPVRPSEVPEDVRFAAVYSNPPVRIGKRPLQDLLAGWLDRLAGRPAEGTAWLVVQRHLGSDSLAQWLQSEGWGVRRVASRKGYRVLEVRARP